MLLLIGRILIAAVFLMTVSDGGPAAAYLKSFNYSAPAFHGLLAHLAEWIIVVTLILGVATRFGALAGVRLRGDRLADGAPVLAISGRRRRRCSAPS